MNIIYKSVFLKVFLGDTHNCTCNTFKKEKDLCKHICWVLLKKFRLSRDDSSTWQLGLCERDINQVIKGEAAAQLQQRQQARNNHLNNKNKNEKENSTNSDELEQRPITEDDICPICQDELLSKKLPVTFCKFGCGNNVHIKCMKVWSDHQKQNGESKLTCPLCREIFSTFELLEQEYRNNALFMTEKQDLHYGLSCKSCHSSPVKGKCYKCTSCFEFYLCQACFNTDFHQESEHSFVFREKITHKYHKASREHVGALPMAIGHELANRDLTEEDYELLIQLENRSKASKDGVYSQIPEKIIKSWGTEKIKGNSQLLGPGYQCRICLRTYKENQTLRRLPGCKHKFHIDCIDNWLLHSHPTCPIDGQVVWDPIVEHMKKEETKLEQLEIEQRQKRQERFSMKPLNYRNSKEMDGSLGLIINYKQCAVEAKPPKGKIELSTVPFGSANSRTGNSRIGKTTQNIKVLSASSSSNSINKAGISLGISINQLSELSIGSNSNEENSCLSYTKSKPKSLIKAQLEKNRTGLIKTPQIEIKGSQFSTQISSANNLEQINNRAQHTKTAQPQKTSVSLKKFTDYSLRRRKQSLGSSERLIRVQPTDIIDVMPSNNSNRYWLDDPSLMSANNSNNHLNGIPTTSDASNKMSSYQLTKHQPKTSDFEKNTYDSVDISGYNNHLGNNNHVSEIPTELEINLRNSLRIQDENLNISVEIHNISDDNDVPVYLENSLIIRDQNNENEFIIDEDNQCLTNNMNLTTKNHVDLNLNDIARSNDASNSKNSKKLINSRLKVNFNKKLTNQNADIDDLVMNLPVAFGIQPIFVNNPDQNKNQDT